MSQLLHTIGSIQKLLFAVEEEWGPLSPSESRVLRVLELCDLDSVVGAPRRGWRGRPEHDRRLIARAFVAMKVLNLPTRRRLLDWLEASPSLRRICGWERRSEIPNESTFSRAFAQFAEDSVPNRVHEALVRLHYEGRLVGHVSRDSTAIPAREKAVGRLESDKARQKKPKRLEQQAAGMSLDQMLSDLPTACDKGCKRNSRGNMEWWRGYKLHIDWGDGEMPLSCILTSASVHDSQVAIPLAEMTRTRVVSLYDLMDSAYDSEIIRRHSISLMHVPIIESNKRNRGLAKLPFNPAQSRRYQQRTTAERGAARLKDDYGARFLRVRGPTKVLAELMFGVLALAAEQLLRLAT